MLPASRGRSTSSSRAGVSFGSGRASERCSSTSGRTSSSEASRACSGSPSTRATHATASSTSRTRPTTGATPSTATARTERCDPVEPEDPALRSGSVRRTTTAATSPSARTGCCTRPLATAERAEIPEDRAQNMKSLFGKLLRLDVSKAGSGLGDRGPRAPERLAVLLRPRHRRPVPRRRRAGLRSRRSTSRLGRAPVSRTTAGTLRGLRALRGRRAESRGARLPDLRVRAGRGKLHGDRGLRLPRPGTAGRARPLRFRRLLQRDRLEPERPLGRGEERAARAVPDTRGSRRSARAPAGELYATTQDGIVYRLS